LNINQNNKDDDDESARAINPPIMHLHVPRSLLADYRRSISISIHHFFSFCRTSFFIINLGVVVIVRH
jgi:hypothetical protein